MSPLLSIVIPNYNHASLLPRSIGSACRQSGDDYEVLVIDDGSTDNSREVLEELTAVFPGKLIVNYQSNAGVAAARNHGIDTSCGRYLLFLDADDELLPDALSIFRKSIADDPDATVHVAPTIAETPGGESRAGRAPIFSAHAVQRVSDYLFKKMSMAHGGVLASRELMLECRYPELPQSEDIPVFAGLLARGLVASVALPTVKIYKSSTSRRRDLIAGVEAAEQLVAELFDSARLPPVCAALRDKYSAKAMLSLFKRCYRQRNWPLARRCFDRAWQANPRYCLRQPRQLLKYVHCRARA